MLSLTAEERRVLELAAHGLTTAQTAEELGVSESTAMRRAAAAMEKLEARNLTQAVAIAIRRGLIDGQGDA